MVTGTQKDRARLSESGRLRPGRRRWISLAVVVGAAIGMALALQDQRQASASATDAARSAAGPSADPDFSKFSHTSGAHSRLPCATCHRRDNTAPQSTRPGHRPCAGCHSQKFADLGGPICTICHTTAEPKSAEMKPPPGLKSFSVRFDHARHSSTSCNTCHKPAARGAAFAVPSGTSAHGTCFECHGANAQSSDKNISSCSTCHSPGKPERFGSPGGYQVNFSHAVHTRNKVSCNECHRIRAGTGGDQVSGPQLLMHRASASSQSCATCHNNKRAFGTDSFADCKRCHTGTTFRFR